MGTRMILSQDFKEFFELLNANKVRYLVIGGYAVALYGYPRYTKDIDVWIYREEKNVKRLLKALNEFGFSSLNLKIKDFMDPEQVIQLGYPPNRIDLLTDIPGVKFEDCYQSRNDVEINNVTVHFIALDDLKKSKKATGRHQDLADLENLP